MTVESSQYGMYDSRYEKDACGVGFVADLKRTPSRRIVESGLEILKNLDHRGAVGADPKAGDGCGLLTEIPDAFFRSEAHNLGIALPPFGDYAVGFFFLPQDSMGRQIVEAVIEKVIADEGQTFLGWRNVPVKSSILGESCLENEPVHRQVFIQRGPRVKDSEEFERRLFILRKVVSNTIYDMKNPATRGFYPVSLSARTIVYKGLVLAPELGDYYLDLQHPLFLSSFVLAHQRFSTNTFPSWQLAHPYRMVAHNGEINTLRGNVNWMAARQASVDSELFDNDISKLWPISYEGQSDTACFDNALEFLVRGGFSLPHAVMMLIPEAWAGNQMMDEELRAFYEYHAALMEPWDGPAAMAFTDGRYLGATLDRNGLRPARYLVTKEGWVVLASEMGVLDIPDEDIVTKWRLQPGKMLLLDLEAGRIVSDEEIKSDLAKAKPYRQWLKQSQIVLEDLPPVAARPMRQDVSLLDRQRAFGYSAEDLKIILPAMAFTGQEATGSMGTDTPLSALSNQAKGLSTYFKQNFAQVTNPPIDPIREELVMSLVSFIGPRPNIFDHGGQSRRKRLEVRQPILTNEDLEKIRNIGERDDNPFETKTLDITYTVEKGAEGLSDALQRLCERADAAVRGGYNILILSDRLIGPDRIPIPALLATAAVHHHLIRQGLRTSVGLVVESGEPREVHDFCCLAGYGAEAINPYLAFETLLELAEQQRHSFPSATESSSGQPGRPPQAPAAGLSEDEVIRKYIKSVDKGILKVMSKMGISTFQSYCGAQIFDAVGLNSDFVNQFFFGTASRIEGVGLAEISIETVRRHQNAFNGQTLLDVGGDYAVRQDGEIHAWTSQTISALQHAVRGNAKDKYQEFARLLNDQSERLLTLRGLFRIKTADQLGRKRISLDQVESAQSIVRRFSTGAMSFGSISREAHTTLAIAMNRLGGKSNTGEGGEESERFLKLPNGDSERSAIKQIASGRFGVTTEYLVNADVIQIKMAQGAKPGEGGQLPGHKVDATIAKVRHSTPGVGLISPPPHHDIYSIEDLAQLIFDLQNVNPRAEISVKLVSEFGVGTVAAGVAKARAQSITISGYEGGTGASPLTSIKHAGSPWELGLAETHQTLLLNRLRDRVRLQADGGLRTGRDVVIAALLGADEFGFATAPLIAAGCLMMRKCHLNTCPVGIATQDPVLRRRFQGTPEHVINYFFFVAEEVRELMADMGVSRFEDLVGSRHYLDPVRAESHWKAKGLDLGRLLQMPNQTGPGSASNKTATPVPVLQERVLDHLLLEKSSAILSPEDPGQSLGRPLVTSQGKEQVQITLPITNIDRSTGTMLSGEIVRRFGGQGLEAGRIQVHLFGTAGQSFGAWLARGVTLDLEGEANDYVGKGLSGGRIILRPPATTTHRKASESIIAGNTLLYGATSGELFAAGVVGERFAVRNSGAIAVVEGTGDHGCEYMTGGIVLVLGRTGRNFAAGMSGGIAYVLDEDGRFEQRCNMAMVEVEPIIDAVALQESQLHLGGEIEHHGRVDISKDMTRFDQERVKNLIEQHREVTGSERASEILSRWEYYRPLFRKVMPVEYKKALAQYANPALSPVKNSEVRHV